MKPVDLNFATAPFRNNTPYYLGYGLGALALAAFTAYNAYAYLAYSKSKADLESDYAQKKVRLDALYEQTGRLQGLIAKQNIGVLNERAEFTNKMLDNRRFSWTALLNALEEVQPYQVRLVSLRPIITPKSILIEARAISRDLKAFWNFQQNLQNDPHFRRVYPGGYNKNSEEGELVFNIAFNYFPDGMAPGMEGLSPEEIAKQAIVDAPGSGSGSGALADEDLPAIDEEVPEPLPSPQRAPHSPVVNPRALQTAPGAAPLPAANLPVKPIEGQAALERSRDTRARGVRAARSSSPPRPDLPPPRMLRQGFMPPAASLAPSGGNAPRPPVKLSLPERGPAPGSGGVKQVRPKVEKPPGLPMAPPVDTDSKPDPGDDDASGDEP